MSAMRQKRRRPPLGRRPARPPLRQPAPDPATKLNQKSQKNQNLIDFQAESAVGGMARRRG
jgi:hypothetical protein